MNEHSFNFVDFSHKLEFWYPTPSFVLIYFVFKWKITNAILYSKNVAVNIPFKYKNNNLRVNKK